MDDPDVKDVMIRFLLSGWEESVRNTGTLIQLLSERRPSWRDSLDEARYLPGVNAYVEQRLAPLRTAVQAVLNGEMDYSQFERSAAAILQKPN